MQSKTEQCLYVFYGTLVMSTLLFFLHINHSHNVNMNVQLHHLLLLLNTTRIYPTSLSTYSFPSSSFLPLSTDREILGTLVVVLCQRNVTYMSEILRGAHIVVDDDEHNSMYYWLKALPGSYRRSSSHKSIVPQIGVPVFQQIHSILTGIVRENSTTWLQFESGFWKVGNVKSVLHFMNYMYYKLIDCQVGPFGVSMRTEARPLRLLKT